MLQYTENFVLKTQFSRIRCFSSSWAFVRCVSSLRMLQYTENNDSLVSKLNSHIYDVSAQAGPSLGVFQACICYSTLKILCQKLNSHVYDVSAQAGPSLGVFQACICYSTLKITCQNSVNTYMMFQPKLGLH